MSDMDPYFLLLDQFDQNHQFSHEFLTIIDIHNSRQHQQSQLIRRKKQQRNLILKTQQWKGNASSLVPAPLEQNGQLTQEMSLAALYHATLRKQADELLKQVRSIRTKIQEITTQIDIFNRKQNQIQQLKYSSKRQLQLTCHQIKTQQILISQIQHKHQRIIQQMKTHQTNLLHQTKYLARQFGIKRSLCQELGIPQTGIEQLNFISQCTGTPNLPATHIEEIYTTNNLQHHLSILHILLTLQQKWHTQSHKQLNCMEALLQSMPSSSDLRILASKKEIFKKYQKKLHISNFQMVPQLVIDHFKQINVKITELGNTARNLNVKLKDLQEEHDSMTKTDISQSPKDNLGQNELGQLTKYNQNKQKQVIAKSQEILLIIQKQFNLANKLTKLRSTLHALINQQQENIPTAPKANKKQTNTQTNKLNNHNRSNSLESRTLIKIISKSNSSIFNPKRSIISKKSSFLNQKRKSTPLQTPQPPKQNSDDILSYYQQILNKNQREVLSQWNKFTTNAKVGVILLQTIAQNDLYRVFCQPSVNWCGDNELENEEGCKNKVYGEVNKIIRRLKSHLTQQIKLTLLNCNTIQNKLKLQLPTAEQNYNSQSFPKYVVEAKERYTKEHQEILEEKRKGVCIDDTNIEQIVLRRSSKWQKSTQIKDLPKPRNSCPFAYNYISTCSEKRGKADKQIRDLLANANSLRNAKKTIKQFRSFSRISLESKCLNN